MDATFKDRRHTFKTAKMPKYMDDPKWYFTNEVNSTLPYK
jgi:hypothetical protein